MQKIVKLNNIKGILIILVVLGHLMEVIKTDYYYFYTFIYSFHMPVFIFISGYLAKHASIKKISNYLLIYFIFQSLYLILLNSLKIQHNSRYEVPYYHLWYLVSMIWWYIIVVLLNKIHLKNYVKVLIIICCFAVSSISRVYTVNIVDLVNKYYMGFYSYYFSYQRTLTFLPYFMMGFFINKDILIKVYSSLKYKRLILPIVILFNILVYYVIEISNLESLFRGSYGVDRILLCKTSIFIEMLISYVITLINGYVFINITTSEKNIITKYGENSLQIFLFHPLVVVMIKKYATFSKDEFIINFIILLVATLITVIILGSNTFYNFTKYICYPNNAIKIALNKICKKKKCYDL